MQTATLHDHPLTIITRIALSYRAPRNSQNLSPKVRNSVGEPEATRAATEAIYKLALSVHSPLRAACIADDCRARIRVELAPRTEARGAEGESRNNGYPRSRITRSAQSF